MATAPKSKETVTGTSTSGNNEAAQDGFVRVTAQTGDLLIMACSD